MGEIHSSTVGKEEYKFVPLLLCSGRSLYNIVMLITARYQTSAVQLHILQAGFYNSIQLDTQSILKHSPLQLSAARTAMSNWETLF